MSACYILVASGVYTLSTSTIVGVGCHHVTHTTHLLHGHIPVKWFFLPFFHMLHFCIIILVFFAPVFCAFDVLLSNSHVYTVQQKWMTRTKKNMGKNCVRYFYHTHTHTFQNYMHALLLHSIRYHVHTACVYVPVPHVQCMKNASFPSTPPHSSILHMCEFEWIAVCEQSSYYFFFFCSCCHFGSVARYVPCQNIYTSHTVNTHIYAKEE